jgi:hypothetical protein
VTLNDHPADGVQNYEEIYEDMAKSLDHDTSTKDPIHFDITDRRFLNAFFDVLHRPLEDQGVDFWWVDWQQGEYSRVKGKSRQLEVEHSLLYSLCNICSRTPECLSISGTCSSNS